MKASPFFKGLSWLLLLNLLVKPLWIFGIDRQVQNIAGHEAYGAYFSILNLSLVLSFLADAGLSNSLNRQLALGQQYGIASLVRLKGILSLAYLTVLFFIAWLTHVGQWEIVLLTGLWQVLTSYLLFYRSVLTGHQLFKKDAWISIADKSLMILVCGILLYAPFAGILSLHTFLYIQAGSTMIALLAAIGAASRQKTTGILSLPRKLLLKQALPFIILILLISVHNRLDAFLLERIHPNGAYEAGIYASTYRLLDAGNMLGYLAASFLVPFAARHISDRNLLEHSALRLRHGLMLISLGAVAIVAVFARRIMQLLYHEADSYSATVLLYCIAVLPAYYLVHIYGSLLTAKGMFRQFTIILLVSAAINILLNVLLIPSYGAQGCCVAALISQYTCGALCLFAASRSYSIRYHWLSLGGYGLAGLFFFGACYAVEQAFFK